MGRTLDKIKYLQVNLHRSVKETWSHVKYSWDKAGPSANLGSQHPCCLNRFPWHVYYSKQVTLSLEQSLLFLITKIITPAIITDLFNANLMTMKESLKYYKQYCSQNQLKK